MTVHVIELAEKLSRMYGHLVTEEPVGKLFEAGVADHTSCKVLSVSDYVWV